MSIAPSDPGARRETRRRRPATRTAGVQPYPRMKDRVTEMLDVFWFINHY